ncbi:MAG: UvrB/UvrC motif-containing protein, partial [Candidatus Margulisbacteria bacterium]|nr:UvrB/UvrC motif-containing protein [Candidatus Margulisiibacteriota bacterium]
NVNSKVILYGDQITRSMRGAIGETARRRKIQAAYNKKHGITPQTIVKEIHDIKEQIEQAQVKEIKKLKEFLPKEEVPDIIKALEDDMQVAATALEFERAAKLRDRVQELKKAFGI